MSEHILWIGAYGSIALFAAYGVLLFMNRSIGFLISGHSVAGMVPSMSGRYFMMLILVAAFWWLQDFRALTLLFLAFTFIAVFDAIVEPPKGGQLAPHVVGGILSLILSYFYWSAWRGGEV